MRLVDNLGRGFYLNCTDPFERSIAIAFELTMDKHLDPWDVDLVKFSDAYMERMKTERDVDLITAPVAIHVGSSDTTARPSSHSIPMFDGLDSGTTRLLAIYQGLDHEEWTDPAGSHIPAMKHYIISWMKVYLDGNSAYQTYIDGTEYSNQVSDTWYLSPNGSGTSDDYTYITP